MSYIDYSQVAEDHQCLLILVRHIGSLLKCKTFHHLWERVRRLQTVRIPNQQRDIWLRYKRAYPVENNNWGDFQAHRKVLGLICVGKCRDTKEFEELFENYKKVKEDYASTIINSRLIILGMNCDGTPIKGEDAEELDNTNENTDAALHTSCPDADQPLHSSLTCQRCLLDSTGSLSMIDADLSRKTDSNINNPKSRNRPNSLTKESIGAEVVFYPDADDSCVDLEERLKELVISLFFVLEGKRLDRSFERTDKLQLLCTPFEKKDLQGLDTDTRSFKKKCQGRLRKHLADLCLQAGHPGEAMLHYQTALDMLKSMNDWLWIGACFEGLCSASVILTYPKSRSPPLKRNLSFCVKRGKTRLDDIKGQSGNTAFMRSYSNGYDALDTSAKNCLNPDDIIEKYKEAITHYSKYKQVAVIEMEASIKACRVLVLQRKFLQASDFLQNVVYISLQSSDEDKIQRYSTLASLYAQIGFLRKASFFRRVAALQSVNLQVPQPSWYQCYTLLLQTLEGYAVSLDPKEFSVDTPCGWPVLQLRVLHELIFSARKMGNPQLSVRHMTFLLHSMLEHLSTQEKRDVSSVLMSYTACCEGTPQPLATDNGIIFPAVPLTKLPFVKSFKLVSPPQHCQPVKIPWITNSESSVSDSLFIYTPLSFTVDNSDNKSSKVDFRWVAGDACEVHLEVYNPMPDELHLSRMGLLTDGVEMDAFPANACIPSESGPHLVKLSGIPKSDGDLNVYGYITHLYGVRSHCKLKDIQHLHSVQHIVEVVPALPQIELTTSLPKAAYCPQMTTEGLAVVATASVVLHAGQSQHWLLTVSNVSGQPVEMLDVTLICKTEHKALFRRVLSWSPEDIQSLLPLQPDSSATLNFLFFGYSQYLYAEAESEGLSPSHSSTGLRQSSLDKKSPEATLKLWYSGGPGQVADYCRQCAVVLSVDILPTVTVHRWDVIPSQSLDECFLLFDLMNLSSHQMEVQYAESSDILIEPSLCRRIAIPYKRHQYPFKSSKEENAVDISDVESALDERRQHIIDCTNIKWSTPAVAARGIVSLENVVWSQAQLNLMTTSHILWAVVVNGTDFNMSNIPEIQVGESVEVQVMLTNTHSADACNAALSLDCYQDFGRGTAWTEVEENFSSIGSRQIKLHKVLRGERVSHNCSFVFYYAGLYKLDITCTYERTDCLKRGRQEGTFVWRCMPVTHINVKDACDDTEDL